MQEVVIKQPYEHIGKLCHVQGWNKACVFKLLETDGTLHVLTTPKTGKLYQVMKPLLYTRKQVEKLQQLKG